MEIDDAEYIWKRLPTSKWKGGTSRVSPTRSDSKIPRSPYECRSCIDVTEATGVAALGDGFLSILSLFPQEFMEVYIT